MNKVAKIDSTFIEQYIKAYNEGKPIEEVMLQYYWEPFSGIENLPPKLKLKADGTVIIHPVKDKMYSLQEISNLLEEGAYQDYMIYLIDNDKCMDRQSENYLSFKEWFDKNYPQ